MHLPRLMINSNNDNIAHNPTQMLEFRGLNLTNTALPGEYKDTLGLSSEGYPFLTQIPERTVIEDYTSPYDVFVWDHDLYVVDGTNLKKNGTVLGSVTAGQKLMTVVNTKLVIFPDKMYVDLTNDTLNTLGTVWSDGIAYTFDDQDVDTISGDGIEQGFSVGDVVDIFGIGQNPIRRLIIQAIEADKLTFAGGSFGHGAGAGGALSGTVRTSIPDLDYICSSGNRLWGVCNEDNTIYASALGDPSDFFHYTEDTGAYSVAVGSEGDFSAICSYGGAVLAWKEDTLHKILGSYPSEYYMIETPIYGVQIGSSRSLVIINNVLYYKGIFGVYQYAGNAPVLISANLGLGIYSNGVATTDGRKYYIGMSDADGEYHLYAFDLLHGMWMKEENERVVAMAHDTRYVSYVIYNPVSDDLYKGRNLMLNTLFPSTVSNKMICIRGQLAGTTSVDGVAETAAHGIKVRSGNLSPAMPVAVPYLTIGNIYKNTLNGLIPGETYTLSCMLKYTLLSDTTADGSAYISFRLHTYDVEKDKWVIPAGRFLTLSEQNKTSSRAVSFTFTVPSTTGAYLTIGCENAELSDFQPADYFALENIKLEPGSEASSWTPAPEDQEYMLQQIGTSLDNRHWNCELAEILEEPGTSMRRKGYLKLIFRLDMSEGSALKIYAKEDRRAYRLLWSQEQTSAVTLSVPIRLGRCDRWQVKMEGVGEVTIRGINREFVVGSTR